MLRAQLGTGGAEIAQLIPELRELLPELPEPTPIDVEGARFRLFDATARLLCAAARQQPVLLVLDDLHAADVSSLLMLQFLVRELGSARLLVLAALRDVDPVPGRPLAALLAEVAREPGTRRLSLRGLAEPDVAAYVEQTAPEISSPELVAALHEQTEGNPLFVGEMVRLLPLEGLGSKPAGSGIGVPQTVRDAIARRLAHLSDGCQGMLGLASILGREFTLATLVRVAGVPEDEVLDVLDEAMAARIVSDVPGGPGRLRFTHVLIRDTLYEGLTSARRVRLHRLAVDAIEAHHGDAPGPHLAELAHHSVAGSEFEKALGYAGRAGDHALALLAYEESARLYETALEALDLARPADEKARCGLLLSLGEAEIRAGNSPIAKEIFLDAAGIARRLGLSSELARAAAGYGGRIVWVRAGGDDRLVPLLEEGLAALAEDDPKLRATLLARLAGALRDEHSRDRRDRLSSEAVELARSTGSSTALAYALAGRAHAVAAPDTVGECLAIGTEICELAARTGDSERIQAGHQIRIVAQLMMGEVRGAESDLAAASRIADGLRQPAQLWDACVGRALLALAAGRLGEAEELVTQAFALGERALPHGAIPIYRLQRHTLCDFRGGLEAIEPDIRDLVVEYPARPVFRCALVHLHARLGRPAEAKSALEELRVEGFTALPFDQEWLYSLSLLAESCVLVGDTESAVVLYELLLPWATFNAVDVAEGFRGSVARYLGLLAATLGRWDDAAGHLDDALAMNGRMGARPWFARTQHDFGRVLQRRDRPEDAGRAQELLDRAFETYREIGMEVYETVGR